ncbi:MAG TPA: GntR family transcriptional regulator [Acidimicrobiia bacterium]|nr:GntR family transcriptional regulator [Acidimicrobiia bacterium]
MELTPWANPEDGSEVLSRRTAQAMIVGRLRIEILSGALPPGSRLLQAKLAERMRTSTTPVRAAMAELAAEGLADVDPHRGVIVHEPTEPELLEIYEMRSLLDPILIEKTVANITEPEVERADGLCDRLDGLTEPGSWVVLNSQFHAHLDDAARSPLLASTVRNLRNRSSIYIAASLRESPDRMVAANAEHRAMVEACRAADVAAALEPTLHHIEATVELVTLYLRRLESSTA